MLFMGFMVKKDGRMWGVRRAIGGIGRRPPGMAALLRHALSENDFAINDFANLRPFPCDFIRRSHAGRRLDPCIPWAGVQKIEPRIKLICANVKQRHYFEPSSL